MDAGITEFGRFLYAMALTTPRVTIALWVLPFLSQQILGGARRAVVGFALASIAMPLTYHQLGEEQLAMGDMLALLPKEVLIGLILGFLTAIPFWVAAAIGQVLEIQRGSLAATMFVPTFQDETSPLGVLLTQAITVLFFTVMGVHVFLGAIYTSYATWPVTSVGPRFSTDGFVVVAQAFQSMFYWTALLSAPALILVLVIDLLMGVLNRFVPQINVFFLALPFKGLLVLGLLVLYAEPLVFAFAREWMTNPGWLEPAKQVLE